MHNQSGLSSTLFSDIFRMREYLLKETLLKNSINNIKNRSVKSKNSLLQIPKILAIKKTKPPINYSINSSRNFFPVINITDTNMNTSPSYIKTNLANHSKHSYQYKVTKDSEKIYQSHKKNVNNFLQAKKRDSFNKSIRIDKENERFGKKLTRINSPLSKNRLNESYSKLKEYGNIAKKIKTEGDFTSKKIINIKYHLPPLFSKVTKKFSPF